MKKTLMAIMYDFDKTLSSDYMQNFGFIPELGITPAEFWSMTNEFAEKADSDRTLAYMFMMIQKAKEKGIHLTKEKLHEYGKNIKFFKGVLTWFSRINAYGESRGVKVEHYIISSGNKEIIDGCPIAKEFKKVFGCEFVYDLKTKEAIWPKICINFTQKTHYFFRVSKGTFKTADEVKVNQKNEKRRIQYRNMVYLGDGMTDIPAMILAHNNGGKSIALYSREQDKNEVVKLVHEDRVNFVAKADYSASSELEKYMQLIIDEISIRELINRKADMITKE